MLNALQDRRLFQHLLAMIGSGRALLERRDFSAVATVDFINLVGFRRYAFVLDHVFGSAHGGNPLELRISQDNGATWKAGAADYRFSSQGWEGNLGVADNISSGAGATSMRLAIMADLITLSLSGEILLTDPAASDRYKHFRGTFLGHELIGVVATVGCGEYFADTNPINGVRFVSAGNVLSGQIELWGFR